MIQNKTYAAVVVDDESYACDLAALRLQHSLRPAVGQASPAPIVYARVSLVPERKD